MQIWQVLESIEKDDFVITDSYATARDLLALDLVNISTVHTIHLGADPKLESSYIPVEPPQIVAIYQDDPRKNSSAYLIVAHHMAAYHPRWRLQLIVSEAAKEKIFDLVSDAGLTNVDLLCSPDDERLLTTIRQSQFAVFLSFYEGFGLVPLEMVKAGCPVICSNTSSLTEFSLPGTIYVSPFHPDEFLAAIDYWIQDSSALKHARTVIEKFANFEWSETVAKTVGFYQFSVNGRMHREQDKAAALICPTNQNAKFHSMKYAVHKLYILLKQAYTHKYRKTTILTSLILLTLIVVFGNPPDTVTIALAAAMAPVPLIVEFAMQHRLAHRFIAYIRHISHDTFS